MDKRLPHTITSGSLLPQALQVKTLNIYCLLWTSVYHKRYKVHPSERGVRMIGVRMNETRN